MLSLSSLPQSKLISPTNPRLHCSPDRERLQITYPNGRLLRYEYNSGADDALNRVSLLADDDSGSVGTHLAEYSYLGLGTLVVEDFAEPQVKLDYSGGTSGTYAGFDRFDRVVQQRWYDYGASADRDKFTYGYDRAGNRLHREHSLASLKDEHYQYDGVNQLTMSHRGTLNTAKTAISDTPVREEDFGLDALGNWTGYVEKTDGATDLSQSRVHNTANELTSASRWATPAHDRAGNLTTVPKPSSLADSLTLAYDAWNRLVQVSDGQTVVATYGYDGRGRRIKRHFDSQSPSSPTGIDRYEHLFYLSDQLVETRQTATASAEPESLPPKYQFVWSSRYIDAPILRDENTGTGSQCDDARVYFLTDANMNVTSLVAATGDALERYVYDPYGRLTIYNPAWSATRSSSSYTTFILYTGRHLDAESGIYYYRARYYHLDLGRFINRDPLNVWAGDANLYRYVANNPVLYTDPTGLYIYLSKGQSGRWDPVGVIHQDIAVDKWKKDANDCWVKDGIASFSFGVNDQKKRVNYPLQRSWLGWTDATALNVLGIHFEGWRPVVELGLAAGKHMEGEIYPSDFNPKMIVSTLKTTPEEDQKWLKYMEGRVKTRDRYTVLRNNCVNYTNHEYADAVKRFGFK